MYGKPIDSIGFVANYDAELAAMMDRELGRQQDGLELIASENFASPADRFRELCFSCCDRCYGLHSHQ